MTEEIPKKKKSDPRWIKVTDRCGVLLTLLVGLPLTGFFMLKSLGKAKDLREAGDALVFVPMAVMGPCVVIGFICPRILNWVLSAGKED